MPEVKFQNISEGNEANAIIKYDKGFYIQSITQGQIQQAGSVDVTACHGIKIISHSCSGPMFPNTHGREQEEEMDYTKCFSSNQFAQNTAKDGETGDGEQTRIFSENIAGIELDETCSKREIFHSHLCLPSSSQTSLEEKEQKIDATPFLASLKSGKISHSFLEQKSACVQKSESGLVASGNISIEQRPFVEITHNTTLQKYGTQQESTNENIELTACYNYEVQTKTEKSKRRSIYESADVDVTTCFGSGLINSPDSIALGGRIHETSNLGSNYCTGLNSIEHLGDQKDATILRCHASETRSNAIDYRSFVTLETQEAHEQAGQLDLTKCYGGIILPNKQGTDHASFPSRSTNTLDFTNCHGQDSFTRPSSSQTHQNKNYFRSSEIGLMASFCSQPVSSSDRQVTSKSPYKILNMPSRKGSAADEQNDNTTLDTMQGHKVVEPLDDTRLKLTTCRNYKTCENNDEFYSQKMKSQMEESRLEFTTWHKYFSCHEICIHVPIHCSWSDKAPTSPKRILNVDFSY